MWGGDARGRPVGPPTLSRSPRQPRRRVRLQQWGGTGRVSSVPRPVPEAQEPLQSPGPSHRAEGPSWPQVYACARQRRGDHSRRPRGAGTERPFLRWPGLRLRPWPRPPRGARGLHELGNPDPTGTGPGAEAPAAQEPQRAGHSRSAGAGETGQGRGLAARGLLRRTGNSRLASPSPELLEGRGVEGVSVLCARNSLGGRGVSANCGLLGQSPGSGGCVWGARTRVC